jgi:hypothetical protein
MAIVFPASPSVNDTFTAGSITYKWDGQKWIGLGVTPSDKLIEGSNSLEITAGNDLVWTGDAVGLKNSSPVMALDIGDGTQQNTLRVNSSTVSLVSLTSGNTSQSRIEFGDVDNNDTGYIYYDNSDDSMRFATNGSNERLRIKSNGVVQIGGSYGNDNGSRKLEIFGPDNSASGILLANSAVSASGTCDISLAPSNGITGAQIFCHAKADFTTGGNRTADLAFVTRNAGTLAEKVRITSDGRLLVGTPTTINNQGFIQTYQPSGAVFNYIRSDGLANGETCIVLVNAKTSGGSARQSEIGVYKHSGITNAASYIRLERESGVAEFLWPDNSAQFRISSNASNIGTTGGTIVGTQTSDERVKNIGGEVSYGLNEVLQLQPKTYALKDDPETTKLGFIAQDVESIIPEAVFDTREELEGHQEGDRTKLGMEYVQLIPVLVNAIKELNSEIETLKGRLDAAGL